MASHIGVSNTVVFLEFSKHSQLEYNDNFKKRHSIFDFKSFNSSAVIFTITTVIYSNIYNIMILTIVISASVQADAAAII